MAAPQRFLQLADVAETLNISSSQVYALVRSGTLEAVKIGGRGQWRVEVSALEAYIARLYEETRAFVESHPFSAAGDPNEADELPDGVTPDDVTRALTDSTAPHDTER